VQHVSLLRLRNLSFVSNCIKHLDCHRRVSSPARIPAAVFQNLFCQFLLGLPWMPAIKEPCKLEACNIQTCLTKNAFQPERCVIFLRLAFLGFSCFDKETSESLLMAPCFFLST
jgi:hypothetical protein